VKPDDKERAEEERPESIEPTKKPYSEPRLTKFGTVPKFTRDKISI
jgi:hypothetical protein